MPDLQVHYRLLYLPGSAGLDRPEEYWKSYHYTIAVKSGTLGEKSRFQMGNIHVDRSNAHLCREHFGAWLSGIASNANSGTFTVVPVPSKDAVVGVCGETRSVEMVKQCCRAHANLRVLDALRFKEQMAKASTGGGTRNARNLYAALEVVAERPFGPVMLVDDVYTSGGHLRAANKRLTEAGFDVKFAAVCGWTVHGVDQRATEAGVRTIDDSLDPPTFDLSEIVELYHQPSEG